MKASRLPGKMLADIDGVSVISLLVRRLRQASRLTDIIVATTDDPADDVLAAAAAAAGIAVFRGSEDDVLHRVVGAQKFMASDIVVEVCGDCPLLDPSIVDTAIEKYLAGGVDVVTTTQPQSYPQGMDVQVFSLSDLIWIEENVRDPAVREHVSLYFYENPGRYRIDCLQAPAHLSRPDLRLQLDYAEDLAVIRAVHKGLSPDHGSSYQLAHILGFLEANSDIAAMNAHCEERSPR